MFYDYFLEYSKTFQCPSTPSSKKSSQVLFFRRPTLQSFQSSALEVLQKITDFETGLFNIFSLKIN